MKNRINRRKFLTASSIATGAFIVQSNAANGWSFQQSGAPHHESSPFAPWHALDTLTLHDALALPAAAILASNPHNTQPWMMSVDKARFQILADTDRHLGSFDPYRREMWIGFGCAVANAEIISATVGFRTGQHRLSGLKANGAGKIVLPLKKAKPVKHPLAPFIRTRRTKRAPYSDRAIETDTFNRIFKLVGDIDGASVTVFRRDSNQGQAFANATLAATRAINADHQMSQDAHVWFRGNAQKVAKYRDGVSIPTAGLPSALSLLGQILPEPNAQKSGEHWLKSTQRQLEHTNGFGLIMVSDVNARHKQIAAGRVWQRLHLAFTSQGLAAQPMNQLPELVDRDRHLGMNRGWRKTLRAIAGPSGHATMAFRFGYPTRAAPHSARRPLDWVLTN